MPRGPNGRCQICKHPERAQIETMLGYGTAATAVARRFNLKHDAVSNHWRGHVSQTLKAAVLAKALRPGVELEQIVAEEGTGVLEHLRGIRQKIYFAFDAAIEAGDRNGVAILAGRLHENLAMVARLTGELAKHAAPSVTNIMISPLFSDLQATLIRTLAPYPDARAAVIQAFRRLEARTAPGPSAPMIEDARAIEASATVADDVERAA